MENYIIRGSGQEESVMSYCPEEAVKMFVMDRIEHSEGIPKVMMVATEHDWEENKDNIMLISIVWVLRELGIEVPADLLELENS